MGATSAPGWRKNPLATRRRASDLLATGFGYLASALLVIALCSILWTLLSQGVAGLSLAAIIRPMGPPGSHGGLANAIVGSIIQTIMSLVIGAPVGLACGIYLAEYGGTSRFAGTVRFVSDVLLSAPSILVGLFVYLVLVAPFGHFSGLAGAVSLAILAVPIIVRTTEDMLRLVPTAMREAGAALGAEKWKVILMICMRSAGPGVLTGILLALARVSGETAPLLFTSLGNQNWSFSLDKPMASLPIAIYQYAGASYEDWVALAWTGALFITFGVLAINIVVRFGFGRQKS
ncbi:phosphate ABC transporter permease PstA [Acidomonas methanolica]|uniref:Phosphate transport system permease protein PstA n=1 Tax=Acidomonas methanolica NBRC 104435 TaxID=1231351 RepID=A0A023D3B9_ACIMT|nr:phosphate ABC transporter permease PstA [Acidomonas methanolica]MBU2654484.1 phosphate ABC transporter permease PstA [Acidomonas methanolica]TCS28287.1 phosphate transport system permease protein [Acidomonas methanolica]GAJ28579.1 ABC transporter phosphate permease PstA [Acidomonas methanolica NBRC 104435]GBQ49146.1 phosphate ABC transporter permease [Acidomonas methanolica]GEK99004.1 phosphate transport system permease protein PstA [Acidomonas methanolica NBRC 104435]